MGLPQINIAFNSKSVSAVERSAMGVVALILRETVTANTELVTTITSVEEIPTSLNSANKDYVEKTLLGTPSKVIIVLMSAAEDAVFNDTLALLGTLQFNYVAMPDATTANITALVTWIKTKRNNDKKTYKAVVANNTADDKGIINFTTEGIVVGDKTYTAQQYTSRIAGILAGLPFTRSSTYFVLEEVKAITASTTPDADIDAGKLILVHDGEKVKIGRGVNSLTTLTANMKADWKKIKIVDVMDMITDDIRDTFNDNYVGKIPNITDNQVLLITSIKAYFTGLANQSILDINYDNTAEIDVATQRLAWEEIGTDTSSLDDTKVREMPFGSAVFLAGNVKIVDAVEDLDFNIFSA